MLRTSGLNKVYYVYILQSSKDNKFYTGFTSDLKRRVKEHQSGQSQSTKSRLPIKLIFYEAYILESDAKNRENYLKTSMGKRVLKKQLSNYLKIQTETPMM